VEDGEDSGVDREEFLDQEDSPETASSARAPYGGGPAAELEEAEFYLKQGLFLEAEQLCRRLLEERSDFPGVLEILGEVEARRQKASASLERKKTAYFDLGAEILEPEPLPETFPDGIVGSGKPEPLVLEESISDSQRGVETELALEDTESHYNLGIAYKEMGLLDDAVSEFDKAGNDPARRVDCLTLKGICLAEQGAFAQAEEAFKSALAFPALTPAERISLNYEVGLLYQAWNRPLDALDCFQNVADADLFFRDAGEKIESLRKDLGLDNEVEEKTSAEKRKKSRISYV
jgi:tetratricopeptide (TPR) repeat protein